MRCGRRDHPVRPAAPTARARPRRAFRRITGAALAALLPGDDPAPAAEAEEPPAKGGKKKAVTDVNLPPNDDKA